MIVRLPKKVKQGRRKRKGPAFTSGSRGWKINKLGHFSLLSDYWGWRSCCWCGSRANWLRDAFSMYDMSRPTCCCFLSLLYRIMLHFVTILPFRTLSPQQILFVWELLYYVIIYQVRKENFRPPSPMTRREESANIAMMKMHLRTHCAKPLVCAPLAAAALFAFIGCQEKETLPQPEFPLSGAYCGAGRDRPVLEHQTDGWGHCRNDYK